MRTAMSSERGLAGSGEAFHDLSEFLFGGVFAFVGFGDVAGGAGILGGPFFQALFVELNAAFLTVDLALEFKALRCLVHFGLI